MTDIDMEYTLDHKVLRKPASALDRGAKAALDLLMRAFTVTEDETAWQEHADGILSAIEEGGLALAVKREMEFEKTLDDDWFSVDEAYGAFPESLLALLP
jgi:hypothetical protein